MSFNTVIIYCTLLARSKSEKVSKQTILRYSTVHIECCDVSDDPTEKLHSQSSSMHLKLKYMIRKDR